MLQQTEHCLFRAVTGCDTAGRDSVLGRSLDTNETQHRFHRFERNTPRGALQQPDLGPAPSSQTPSGGRPAAATGLWVAERVENSTISTISTIILISSFMLQRLLPWLQAMKAVKALLTPDWTLSSTTFFFPPPSSSSCPLHSLSSISRERIRVRAANLWTVNLQRGERC
ncbi:hypothetical protein EYF80_029557 [Liparis tanakae]|uniref:Uncharacterized protein n=1 Tax=Liparis tanakae TaxID=230148 RepID=A0A4Z2H5S3_9TELE|nr:hypothetical protein EYF80_029557 [Liparis tanakae]